MRRPAAGKAAYRHARRAWRGCRGLRCGSGRGSEGWTWQISLGMKVSSGAVESGEQDRRGHAEIDVVRRGLLGAHMRVDIGHERRVVAVGIEHALALANRLRRMER